MVHHDGYWEALRRIKACRFSGSEELDLGGLKLHEIPPELLELGWLKQLYLGPSAELRNNQDSYLGTTEEEHSNTFSILPDNFAAAFPKLECLDVSRSKLSTLSQLTGFRSLTVLQCWDTQVSDLSPITKLTTLTELKCNGTLISDLSPLVGLTGLTTLDCCITHVEDLTPISELTALTKLNCWATQVSDLTPLSGLYGLKELNCSQTAVRELSPLSKLTALTRLSCWATQVCDLTPLSGLTALTELHLWNTKVSDLSPLVGLTSLSKLNISQTDVRDLTPLTELTELTELDCWRTQVSDLAPLAGLTDLNALYCSNTQVSDLVPLTRLKKLVDIDCAFTQVSDLAPLAKLTGLLTLDCSSTQVNDLAPISGLKGLASLRCNSLQAIDLSPISELKKLSRLECSGCNLRGIPESIWQSEILKDVTLYNSVVQGIPDEVLSRHDYENCLPALRAHLADLGDDPQPLADIKLMVLGNGRIGKTQICNRLRGLDFDVAADSTHGIQLSDAPIPDSSGQFSIWDFGGQDIYFGTHALFLKSRAVFLLVWTPDTDNSIENEQGGVKVRNRPVSWWLDTVRRLGDKNTPLIAIQNQLDRFGDAGEHPAVAKLRQEDHYCRSLSYSAKTQEGEQSLKERLHYAAKEFNPPLIGKVRLAVIHELRKLRDADASRPPNDRKNRTLSFPDFEQLCNKAGGVNNTELFLKFLHNAGEVFWQQGLFGNAIILDQAWVLEAVYSVFDRTKSYQYLLGQRGCFTRETLGMLLWDKASYTEAEQKLFLGFMQQAGICFAASSKHRDLAETIFVAPDLLPGHYADEGITGTIQGSCHTLEFPTLPPGFMRNVIVRVGRNAQMNCHYWRHGFCGYDATTKARVRVEQTIREDWSGFITITAEGTQTDSLIKTLTKWIHEEAQLFGLETEEHRMPEQPEKLPEPNFQPDPKRPLNYFVSYAWADEKTPDRDKIVDEFCQSAQQKGVQIRRDKDEIGLGDSISDFMGKLTKGDKILIVLTDKYLRSRNCMYELCEIWRLAKGDKADFLEKARLFSAPDAGIFTPVGRAKIARYWKEAYDEEKDLLDHMGPGDRLGHHRLKTYAAHVGEILEVVADTLQPRTLEDLLTYALD